MLSKGICLPPFQVYRFPEMPVNLVSQPFWSLIGVVQFQRYLVKLIENKEFCAF
jgi:hypothetical protein